MNRQRLKCVVQIPEECGPVCDLNENTTHLSMESQVVRLRFDGRNRALEFLYLGTDTAYLLPCGLYLCDHELKLLKLFHWLTIPKREPEVQECFPKTFKTESVAINPLSLVFHMARRSLQVDSCSEIWKDSSLFQIASQSVAKHAASALVSV
jgi:hypothetical protein